MISLEKVFQGPYGTDIKIGVPIFSAILAILLFLKWQRPAMGVTYEILALLISHRYAVIFLGTTLLTLGILSPKAFPKLRVGNSSVLISALVIAGILLPALAFLSPLMQSVPRWAGPSIGLVQFDNSSGLGEPLSKAVASLNNNLDETVGLSILNTRPENLVQVLGNVSRHQYDIVVLDYPNPTRVRGSDLSRYLNSRSLYILTQPANPDLPLPKNVVYLSPPVVDEVYALASAVPSSINPIGIVNTQSVRSSSATTLLGHVLQSRGHSLLPTRDWSDIDFPNLQPGQLLVWLGWERQSLPDGTILNSPSVISIPTKGTFSVKSMRPLPYVDQNSSGASVWTDNQVLALKAILEAHFIETKRPLNTDITIEAVVHRLANKHLVTVSKAMRLVPRYEK